MIAYKKSVRKSLAKCKAREKQCVANCTVFQFVIVMVAFIRAVFTLC